MYKGLKLGLIPTRRGLFSAADASLYKEKTRKRLVEMGVDCVDIDDINDEGLLYSLADVDKVADKMRREGVDALLLAHCNFGSESAVAQVARAVGVPCAVWGPRDEAPLADGSRLRDSQCGLFATGKILRRNRVPFSYIVNCRLEDTAFARGIDTLLRAANVVKVMRGLRILQIGPRPMDFATMMVNEGELLEKFGIMVMPIALSTLTDEVLRLEKAADADVDATVRRLHEVTEVTVPEESVRRVAAMKIAMQRFARQYDCRAIAIQCWDALQDSIQIMPCMANSLLNDDGIPVTCETDIHGAIGMLMAQAAALGETAPFFADWTVRHPDNDNGELLQHCGPWPCSLCRAGKQPVFGRPFAFAAHHPGSCGFALKPGELTMTRFDGDNGEYRLLLGHARVIDGPFNNGTYGWIEVEDWLKLEEKLVEGPYVHHVIGIHGDYVPALYEALKYLPGIAADLYDKDAEEKIGAWRRAEK